MRVISGKYRSLTLATFRGEEIRPTADRVKESLFNILSGKVGLGRVLDLFCGSGSLGIECLSRGAEEVHFNDVSKTSLEVLYKNLKKLGGTDNYKVTNYDFSVCLNNLSGKFDVIFLDPPYKTDHGRSALEIISARNLLNTGGLAVLESDRPFSGRIESLTQTDERKYGITYLDFFGVTE